MEDRENENIYVFFSFPCASSSLIVICSFSPFVTNRLVSSLKISFLELFLKTQIFHDLERGGLVQYLMKSIGIPLNITMLFSGLTNALYFILLINLFILIGG